MDGANGVPKEIGSYAWGSVAWSYAPAAAWIRKMVRALKPLLAHLALLIIYKRIEGGKKDQKISGTLLGKTRDKSNVTWTRAIIKAYLVLVRVAKCQYFSVCIALAEYYIVDLLRLSKPSSQAHPSPMEVLEVYLQGCTEDSLCIW